MSIFKIIAIILLLILGFFTVNSCRTAGSEARSFISFRYNGQYTGIDTLINVDGYFTIPGSDYVNDKFSFYRDGTLLMKFTSKRILNCYENGTDGLRKFNKDKFFWSFENDSIVITWFNPGLYKIQNDTIMAQTVYQVSRFRTKIFFISFKILSKDKLRIIKYEGINLECSYCNEFIGQELHFYPAWRPDSTDNWLRDLPIRKRKYPRNRD